MKRALIPRWQPWRNNEGGCYDNRGEVVDHRAEKAAASCLASFGFRGRRGRTGRRRFAAQLTLLLIGDNIDGRCGEFLKVGDLSLQAADAMS